jgi:hypothetical protein
MFSAGAAHRAAVQISSGRAEASRKNGAKSRGPRTEEGRARSAQLSLKHGMRAQKYVLLPDEDAAEFARSTRRCSRSWRPQARSGRCSRGGSRLPPGVWRGRTRIEVEPFEEPHIAGGGPGLALIRDGNGTRSFETLLRYRGAAMAEFWRALRALKGLQAEQAVETGPALETRSGRGTANARPSSATERTRSAMPGCARQYSPPEPPAPSRTLHEPAAPWLPNGPETRQHAASAPGPRRVVPNEPGSRENPRDSELVTIHRNPTLRMPTEHRDDLASGQPSRGGASARAV